ncbi:hypothetical protein LTR94_034815, partial [Friedmanniomyces endolithicus]
SYARLPGDTRELIRSALDSTGSIADALKPVPNPIEKANIGSEAGDTQVEQDNVIALPLDHTLALRRQHMAAFGAEPIDALDLRRRDGEQPWPMLAHG